MLPDCKFSIPMAQLVAEDSKEGSQEIESKGYDFDSLKDPQVAKKLYKCGLCRKMARKAVELSCPAHDEDLVSSIYCEKCLKSHLSANNNLCPSTKHPNATYEASRAVRRQILSLEVVCPHGKGHMHLTSDNINDFDELCFSLSLSLPRVLRCVCVACRMCSSARGQP